MQATDLVHARSWAMTLPPAPHVFFGRDTETAAILSALLAGDAHHARIAILGAPGIGKTSAALRVMHDPQVAMRFAARRLFVPCDAATASGALLALIASALGVTARTIRGLRNEVVAAFSGQPTLLLLDNLETPWEPADVRADTEDLLATLASIDAVSLIVTMRGTERPSGVQWTRPFLPSLQPLAEASAFQTFSAISDVSENIPDLQLLMDAVDRMPLAITLMASLAQYQPCSDLVAQWNETRTAMLHRSTSTRVSSVDVSIRLSVASPRIQSVPGTEDLLFVLALLPDGAEIAQLPLMAPSLGNISKSVSAVLRTALAYNSAEGHIRVLTPIRAFMLRHHRPNLAMLWQLQSYATEKAAHMFDAKESAVAAAVRSAAAREASNLEAILMHCLAGDTHVESVIAGILNLATVVTQFRPFSRISLEKAERRAAECGFKSLQARCLRTLGLSLGSWESNAGARDILQTALSLAAESQDPHEEVMCLLSIANPMYIGGYDTSAALDAASRAAALADKHGLAEPESIAYRLLAEISYREGDLDAAFRYARRSMHLLTVGPKPNFMRLANVLILLGSIDYHRGDLRRSTERYERALVLAERVGFSVQLFVTHASVGQAQLLRANMPSAHEHLQRAKELTALVPKTHHQHIWHHLVGLHLAMDRALDAVAIVDSFQQRQDDAPRTDAMPKIDNIWPGNLRALGDVEMHARQYDAARDYYRLAQDAFAKWAPGDTAECLFDIAETCRVAGDSSGARNYYILSATIHRKLKERVYLMFTLSNLADTFVMEGDLDTALALTAAVLPAIKWSDMRRRAADCHFRLSQIAATRGETEGAAAHIDQAEDWYERGYDKRGAARCAVFRVEYGLDCADTGDT